MFINDKNFEIYLSKEDIKKRIKELAQQIEKDYMGRNPLFIGILNGCFIFAADLLREMSFSTEITFTKISSYAGMKSTGKIERTIALENIEGRDLILVEDIVDTGNTLINFMEELKTHHPASVEIATLLFKEEALKHRLKMKYIGFTIPDKFVIGYGLDYDGAGRNLQDIYQHKE